MARATGIQITGTTVRVVEVDGTPKKFKVRGFGEASFESGDDADQDAALVKAMRDAFKGSRAHKEHVILGLPIRDCIIREITVPFTDVEQIAKVIKFESETHLHSCSIDEVVVAFRKVAESGNRSTLIVMAARKARIKAILEALEKIGVDPLAVDVDAAGLFGALLLTPQAQEHQNYVVCDIGYSSTMIMLIKDGDLRILRSVRMGTESITARVSKDLDIDRSEAHTRTQAILQQDIGLGEDLLVRPSDVESDGEETRKTATELERDIVRQRQHELIERLQQEIYRSINPAKMEEPLECVFLTGPGSGLPRINAELAETMSTPVKTLDILDQADHRFSSTEAPVINAAIATPIGLSMKQLGLDPLKLDFRQEEFVFSKRFDRLKVPLLCLVLLLVALNAFAFVLLQTMRQGEENKLKKAAEAAATMFKQVADPAGIPEQKKKFLDYKPGKLEDLYRGASADLRSSYERITYIDATIKKMHRKLQEDYNLGGRKSRKRRSSSRRGKSSKRKAKADPSEYYSALDRLDAVMKCWKDVGVREFSIDRLKCSPNKVEFALTLPKEVKLDGKVLGFLDLIGRFENNLKALPKEFEYVSFDGRGYETHKDKPDFILYKTLIVEFAKEVL